MRKKLMILLSAAMLFNSLAGLTGYAETTVDSEIAVVTDDENIKTETGTTKVCGTTNPYWIADDTADALKPFAESTVKAQQTSAQNTVTAEDLAANDDIIGNPVEKGGVSFIGVRRGYAIVAAPENGTISRFKYYIFAEGGTESITSSLSVSDELNGTYNPVTVTLKKLGYVSGRKTNHFLYEVETAAEISNKYVKVTLSEENNSFLILGAFEYDWLKTTDLSQLPDGTNKVSGTTNEYWIADSTDDALKPFAEYTVKAQQTSAQKTVTAEDLAANKDIIGNPVETGGTSFIGVRKGYAVFAAPANTFIRRFKYYIFACGSDTEKIVSSLSVSDEINGTYNPTAVTVKKLGYVSGRATNHFLYEVETAEQINCKYVKVTLSEENNDFLILGAFEYDYKINKAAMALDKVFYTYDDILNGQDKMNVEDDLKLFETIEAEEKEYTIEWLTTDEAIIASDGTVRRPTQSKSVTVTAKVFDNSQTMVYSKNYDVTVAAIGSTLVLKEDFEAAVLDEGTGTASVNGYNGWISQNTEKTKSAILKDPSNADNKALWVYREDVTSDGDKNQKDYDEISGGKLELSFKHMTTSSSTQSRVGWCGMDLYIRASGIYGSVSGTSISFTNQKKVTWKLGVWHEYRFVIDMDRALLDIYFEGEQILDDCVLPSATYTSSYVSLRTKRNGNYGSSYFDDVCMRNLSPSDEDAIKYDADLISIPEATVDDIELPAMGNFDSIIAWDSSHPSVIDNNGIVTQGAEDTDVTLHATLARGEYIEERDFTIKVLGAQNTDYITRDEEAIKAIAEKFSLEKMLDGQSALNITDDITLPLEYSDGDAGRLGGCNISWSSDGDALTINGSEGIVTRGENDTKITLTAEFSFKEDSETKTEKTYTLIISGEGEYEYHNTFDGAGFGNKASLLDGVSVTEAEDSGSFYGAWQSPTDLLNGVLAVTRTDLTSVDKDAVLATDYTGKNAEAGFSFYLTSPADRIDVSLDGVDISVYVKSSQISVDGVLYDTTVTTKEWHKLVLRFDDYNKFCYVYLDGTALSEDPIEYDTDFEINSITVSNDATNGTLGSWYADDVYIKDIDVSDEEAIRRTIAAIDIADTAEWNITLPKLGKLGASISWSSEDDTVLDGNGIVKRTVGGDKTITLTASVSRGGVVVDADFDVVVPGLTGNETPTQEKFEEHVNAIDISELTSEKYTEITKDLDLFSEYMNGNCAFYGGMDVTWSSEHTQVITDDGKVTRPMLDKGVTMTATFTSKRDTSVTAQKDFHFIVLAPFEMICYEDFDDITEAMVGTNINEYKDWTFEKQIEVNKSMIADLEIDPADKDKPFNEANKAFRISRWRNSSYPERARWYFTAKESEAMIEADAVAFSFKIKYINTKSKLDFALGGLSGIISNGSISNSTTVKGSFTSGSFPANEWHTLTFIVAPASGVVYFLIDGNKGFSEPYGEFDKKLSVRYLELHTFRKRGQSDYYIDDISIRVLKDSDKAAVEKAFSELTLPQTVIDTVTLPSFGAERTNISWISDSHDVILDSGEIVGTGDALLKAIITRGTAQSEKEFSVNVTKTDSYDFTVKNLMVSNGIISGAEVSYTEDTAGTELVVLVYNNGRLCALRNTQITGTAITFDAVDISEFYDCEIEAYVKKGSDIVSNVYVTNPQ
ncbi:MAG: hypothetical protein IJC09_08245 [Clostridia bacterium]|nr:hypothetical protein [Clostridia bacterium]